MEWIYIIGLIGYYLYKAYNKGIENATKNPKPIKKVEQREPEKSFEDILKEIIQQNEPKVAPKPTPPPKQQQKPVVKSKPLTPNTNKRSEDPILHNHDIPSESIEYDANIENICQKRYNSIETSSNRIEAKEDENYNVRKSQGFKGLLVDGKLLSAKEMLIAQTVFERKF